MEKMTSGVFNKKELETNLLNWEWAKSRITCRLVNRDANMEKLKDCPFIPADTYLKELDDLIISFHVFLNNDNGELVSVKVTNQLVETWRQGATKDFCDMAIVNTEQLFPMNARKLCDILSIETDECDEFNGVYVYSNKDGVNGATVALYSDFISSVKRIIGTENVMFIPSSIHEWLVQVVEPDEQDVMDDVVRQVNECELAAEEILSDHAYLVNLG